jgi:hypothetical protein
MAEQCLSDNSTDILFQSPSYINVFSTIGFMWESSRETINYEKVHHYMMCGRLASVYAGEHVRLYNNEQVGYRPIGPNTNCE